MKKKLLFLLCLLMMLPAYAGQKKTFTAASLNVDGLPPTVNAAVTTVKLNPEGPQEKGTLQISKLVSQKGWDFFAVSEAFNYNDQLMSELGGVYSAGTFRSKIPTSVGISDALSMINGSKWFDTDGLNLLWRAGIEVSGEQWTLWNKRNGTTSDGADQLIAKGYRYYKVSVGTGMDIDVYIHHMDAETSEADNAAREIQMNQLVDAILASDNKRPIIIMGDTNCRYTRDRIKEIMFDRINADPRFTMHDPWIDFPRQGVFPQVGTGSIMVPRPYDGTEESHQGFQTGEVVDKIWWIENTDASCSLKALNYLQDTDFTWPDGSEISDHYPIVIDFEIEKLRDEVTGGQFYIRNVGTDKYMAAGHSWGTRGIVNKTGISISLEAAGDGNFYLSPASMYTNDKTTPYLGDNLYMDNGTALAYTLTQIEGTSYYTITRADNGQALAASDSDDLVWANADATDPAQQWEMTASQTRLENLKLEASESNPMDATFLIGGYSMPRNDSGSDQWLTLATNGGSVKSEIWSDGNNDCNSVARIYNDKISGFLANGNKSKWTLSHTDAGLPNGKYEVGCQIFSDANDATLSFNGKSVPVTKINKSGTYSLSQAGKDFENGMYKVSTTITITDNKLTTDIQKNGSNTSAGQVVFDNFYLTYLGPTAEDLAAINRVKEAIDDAQYKADQAGLSEYNNRAVVNAYESRLISGDGSKEVHNTYIALAKAATKQRTIPADMRYAILNNSFEMGDLTEWKSNATNAKVEINTKATDGAYLFKADKGSISYDFEVTMPNGIYQLSADVTPGTVLTAAGEKSAPAEGADGELVNVTLNFIISAGTTTIGAENAGAFIADNFVVTRLTDHKAVAAFALIKTAMTDATEKINRLGAPYNEGWAEKMAPYQAKIDNLDIDGDGTKEFTEIYDLLREMVFSQPTKNDAGIDIDVDYTAALVNPSFELNGGSTLGWTLMSDAGDTAAKPNSDGTYTMSGCDGNYVFNTWQDGRGTVISQTINNLPAGHYVLQATFANDENCYAYLEARDNVKVAGQRAIFQVPSAKNKGEVHILEFEVAEGTPQVTIYAGGSNNDGTFDDFGGDWYKVDNFRLIRQGDAQVCYFYKRLQKAIDETTAAATKLPEAYASQWDASDYQDLIDRHLADGHNPEYGETGTLDPMQSNGVNEINELYQRLRDLIFSQNESGADMTGAITNPSFELGDLTGWTCNMEPNSDAKVTVGVPGTPTYGTEGTDGQYLYNAYQGGTARPIHQVLPNVPAGIYTISVKIASYVGNKFFIGANDMHSEVFTTTDAEGVFNDYSFTFEVTEDQDVKIGVYPTLSDDSFDFSDTPVNNGPWYKVDNFRLKLETRLLNIGWEMETDTYGTIMLPFDVPAKDIAEKQLELYLVVGSDLPETPADPDVNELYRILELKQEYTLHANVPYIVKNVAEDKTANKPEFNFIGFLTNDESSYKPDYNLLTGTFVKHVVNDEEHHLEMTDDNIGFMLHAKSDSIGINHDAIEPYHAYIYHPWHEYREFIHGFYFEEPVLPVQWTMEGTDHGTIILPFEAEIPVEFEENGLKVYELSALGETVEYEEVTYKIFEKTEVTDKLEANTPYMVLSINALAAEKQHADAENAMYRAPEYYNADNSETFTHTFKGQAVNSEAAYNGALLTGVFKTTDVAADNHLLDETEGVFYKSAEAVKMPPYHAYITLNDENKDVVLAFVSPKDDQTTGVANILAGELGNVDVYNVSGILLRSDVAPAEALRNLAPGIYILSVGDLTVKVLK